MYVVKDLYSVGPFKLFLGPVLFYLSFLKAVSVWKHWGSQCSFLSQGHSRVCCLETGWHWTIPVRSGLALALPKPRALICDWNPEEIDVQPCLVTCLWGNHLFCHFLQPLVGIPVHYFFILSLSFMRSLVFFRLNYLYQAGMAEQWIRMHGRGLTKGSFCLVSSVAWLVLLQFRETCLMANSGWDTQTAVRVTVCLRCARLYPSQLDFIAEDSICRSLIGEGGRKSIFIKQRTQLI